MVCLKSEAKAYHFLLAALQGEAKALGCNNIQIVYCYIYWVFEFSEDYYKASVHWIADYWLDSVYVYLEFSPTEFNRTYS